ncbi:3-isopropylmalate dehydratase large subunit [Candidatus Sumerlaeota bacterium]|nr:3-isopropylmalate dehydratase large subunit [Candidatus Sumerlaeota bacterium]
MGKTIAEKILEEHLIEGDVKPGNFVYVRLDLILANDITAPLAIKELEKYEVKELFDNERIALVCDHFTPNKDIKSAEQCAMVRRFAIAHNISLFYEGGNVGIEHALLPEQGLVVPGDVVIGADSHTCTYGALGAFATGVGSSDVAAAMITGETWFKVPETIKFVYNGTLQKWVGGKDIILFTIGQIGVDGALYKAMEFTGEVIRSLNMDHRLTISNMAIEAGAKAGIIPPDDITEEYVQSRATRPYKFFKSDPDAIYAEVKEYDVSELEPQVALPHLPENAVSVREVEDIEIDQAVIGSCTNGRMSDLREAAEVLEGRKVNKRVRCLVFPGTPTILRQALEEGVIKTLLDAGCVLCPPSCGPCLGGHLGVLAKGERAISTTNRNFVGRMGHKESEVYLSNPAVAAASAIAGKIIHPENL